MAAAFEDFFGEAVVYAAGTGAETVYVTDSVNGAYALTLFYTAEDPAVFRETAVISNPGAMFEQVTAFWAVSHRHAGVPADRDRRGGAKRHRGRAPL